ncbi:MAG TPA: Fe-S cluster assembly ATPase SufC [Acidimicrobiia bacterium]|nr:Fe-S cluster assembly ATPase SufC [Acidimicrobiia bacterium]
MNAALALDNLEATAGPRQILNGIDLEVPFGAVHAVMGPNGSGKSTLCHVLSGKAGYEVSGSARLDGTDLLGLAVHERARLGLIQCFQYPTEIPGVRLRDFMLEAAADAGIEDATQRIDEAADRFDMTRFLDRSVNDDLSGGEKKRSEIFQIAVLEPKVALLDEVDSGLDIDAVRDVAAAVDAMRSPEVGVLMITHYSRILRYVIPDRVHVLIEGKIVASGGPELAETLEEGGYERLRAELGLQATEEQKSQTPDPFSELPFER